MKTLTEEQIEEVWHLVTRKSVNVNLVDDNKLLMISALHSAAMNGHFEIVKLLIEAGASVNIQTNGGWTPLCGAAENGHFKVVQFLLQAGADVNMKDNHGATAVHYAASNGDHLDIVKLLLQEESINNVNVQDNNGKTELHWAAEKGHLELVHLLLAMGIDADIKDNAGWIALHYARKYKHSKVAKLLKNWNKEMKTKSTS